MKIALIHPRLDRPGGAENLLLWMAQGLRDRGHTLRVLTRRFEASIWPAEAWRDIDIVAFEGRFDHWRSRRGRAMSYARTVEKHSRDCQLLIAGNQPAQVWATLALPSGDARKTIWYCNEPSQRLYFHKTLPNLMKASQENPDWSRGVFRDYVAKLERKRKKQKAIDEELDRQGTASLDLILTNSHFMSEVGTEIYGRPVECCWLGFEPPKTLEPEADAPQDYVLWITNPLPYKNAVGFFEAVRIAVFERGAKDLRVRIVGIKEQDFGAQVEALGLSQHMIFEGRVSDETLHTRLSRCQFLVYPSVDEPFGIVPLEAMAHKRPVLASNIGGPCDTVIDGQTGLSANPLDPTAFAEALVSLWRDKERCEAMGLAGYESFQENFQLTQFIDRLEHAIDRACSGD